MTITYSPGKVKIKSPLGTIEGDSLLHYAIAKIFTEQPCTNYKDSIVKEDRVITFDLEEEKP